MKNNKKQNLEPLLNPKSIAFVGATTKPDVAGNDMLLEVLGSGYKGRIYCVNPKYDEIEGIKCYSSLADLPEKVDLVVLAIGNARLETQLKEAIQLGIGSAVLFGSAFLEEDVDPPLMQRIAKLAKGANMPICGAGAMGFYNLNINLRIFPQHIARSFQKGTFAYISQSGSGLTALLWNDQKIHFNLAVSTGQELVTTASDYLDYALDMPGTKVVAFFLESVRDPKGFTQGLEKARKKEIPIVVLKVGRTEASAKLAVSHSGAIAGNDSAFQALFARYGVIQVKCLEELAATCQLLSMDKKILPGHLAAIMDSGGEREVLMDLACDMKVEFADIGKKTIHILKENLDAGLYPINPLDAWGTGNNYESIYENCLQALVDDKNTAITLLVADLTSGFWLHETFASICRKVSEKTQKPIVVMTNHIGSESQDLALRLQSSGITVLSGTIPALQAIKHAFDYRDFITKRSHVKQDQKAFFVVQNNCHKHKWLHRLQQPKPLDELESLSLLQDYQIPVQIAHMAISSDEAIAAANKIGYPVAIKTAMPGILHKSDVGGVKLNLATDRQILDAYTDLANRLGDRVLVTRMETGSVEVAFGCIKDPQFGPLVLIASGGVFIEIFKDKQIALPPFGKKEALAMINQLKIKPLLEGIRGTQICDKQSLAEAFANFSVLAYDLGEFIKEMDINPIKVSATGCVAVDVMMVHQPS
ncbi:MAG: acetate--CoA ligase family protein [Deltaproteobacteria bacterium]|nr:acetate--CoA ligase family protein [Candidatus Desulfobacula maris]